MKVDAVTMIKNAIKRALKPHGKIDLFEWCKENVRLPNSPKSKTMDFDLTPYFKEPYEEILTNPSLKECYVCASVGAGKSAFVTALTVTSVALFPKELMYVAQSEVPTFAYFEQTLKPSLKGCKAIKKIWPGKSGDKKESLHFPTCNIYTGYASALNTLQSKSIDLLLLDEVWMFEKEGVISEARARLHQRPAARMVGVSQGGVIGDQFHKAYSNCLIKKYAWKCPCCCEYNIYKFDDLKFEYEKTDNGTPIWKTVKTQMECPKCNSRFDDTIETRRSFSENGKYIVEDPEQNALPDQISYNFNQLAVFDVPWTENVRQFLTANNSPMRSTELKKWRQKKMGEFFDESTTTNQIDLTSLESGYQMDDFKHERWDCRFITADVQQDRIYIGIRDWTKQGSSRLVTFKYVSQLSDIEKLRVEYNVKTKETFVDAAYRPEEVKLACAQYGWIGLNGRGDQLFKIKDKNKTIERAYSAPVNYTIKTNNGLKNVQVINYAGTTIKDILTTIQSGNQVKWDIPSGGENHSIYMKQLKNEVRMINQATGKPYYKKVGDEENHAFDIEVEQIVAAMIWGCLVFSEDIVEE